MLLTKLHRPTITKEHVYRDHLIDQLDKNVYKPLTLVSAGAGYGKSMLISSWLEKSNIPYAWISLGNNENDYRSFITLLTASIRKTFPKALSDFSELIEYTTPPPLHQIAEVLINGLDEIEEQFVLVLDDYHTITNQDIHELIKQLLKFPPQQMHLVISTRRDPALGLHALRANNRINEIGIQDLCFNEIEIAELNKKLLDVDLKLDTIKALMENTEGWVVGLKLASLTINDANNADEIYLNISASTHFIANFLISEVLQKQPDEIRKLLLITSVLDRFCVEVLEDIFKTESSKEYSSTNPKDFILLLLKSNIFIIQLDNEQKWFRYHHLFQELLIKELKKNFKKEEINECYNRAASWFEENGFFDEAIDYSIKAENYPKTLKIIEKNWLHAFNTDMWHSVENWIQRLPEKATEGATLLLFIKAWIMHAKHQISELPPIIEQINASKTKLDDMEEGYLAFFQCMFTYYTGQIELALQLVEKALKFIPIEQVRFRADIGSWYKLILQSLGRTAEAFNIIDIGLKDAGLQGDSIVLTRFRAQQAYLHMVEANLYGLSYASKAFLKIDGLKGFTLGFSGYFHGCSHWWQNDYKGVIKNFDPAITYKYQSNARVAADAYIAKAIALQKLNKPDEADRLMEQMKEFVTSTKDADVFSVFSSGQVRLGLLQNKLNEAEEWLVSNAVTPLVPTEWWWIESPAITRCRVLIAIDKPSYLNEAINLLEEFQKSAEAWHNTLRTIEVLLLQCVANCKMDKYDLASDKLRTALKLASKGMWVQPFVESGTFISGLLNELRAQKIEEAFITVIQEEIKKEKELIPPADRIEQRQAKTEQTFSESLSKRESEVLQLIAKGLRNKEISSAMFVSESTIKSHIYNIFKKLEVGSRVELINKAQKTGMLQSS